MPFEELPDMLRSMKAPEGIALRQLPGVVFCGKIKGYKKRSLTGPVGSRLSGVYRMPV
jgi:hypothetical protein